MAERVPIWYGVHGAQASSVEAHPILQKIAADLHEDLGLSIAIARAIDDRGEIRCIASSGSAAPPIGTVVDPNHGICGRCVRQNRLQLANDTAAVPTISQQLCERLGIRSILAIPLRQRSRCIGLLAAFSDVPNRFDCAFLERMRREATNVEEQLGLKASQGLNLLSRQPPVAGELQLKAIGATAEDSEARSFSANRRHLAQALLGPLRPISIAALILCGLSTALLLPRAKHPKIAPAAAPQVTSTRDHAFQAASARNKNSADDQVITEDPSVMELRRRAESGNVRAQISLAARYEKGDGVPRDRINACVWYIMAGSNGDLRAKQRAVVLSHGLPQYPIAEIRFNVGRMYMQGVGTGRDLVAAYSWFSLAQAAGDVRARVEQEKLESMMSRDQVSEALHRASAWLVAHRAFRNQDGRMLASVSSQSH